MNEIIINKANGGLGRKNPSEDMISGFLANGVAVTGGVQLDTVYRLKSIDDALALLITADYDEANNVLVYEHIKEYFRINPNGDLYILLLAQTVAFDNMLDLSVPANAKKLLTTAEGKIKQLAVAYNPTTAVTDFTNTSAAITKAQALASHESGLHRPVQILLEGKGFDYTTPVNLRALNAPNVSVMVGQDLSVANRNISASTPFLTYAAVGTLLGAVSKAAVNENIAWVSKFNLLGDSLLVASITGTKVSDIADADLETLNDNGSIFLKNHIGISGIYFNDSHTAVSLTDDYAYIENNRTIDKAVKSIRTALLPRLNSPVEVDSSTGQLSPEVVKSYEMLGRNALEQMLNVGEISSFDVYIDPSQDILSSSELKMNFSIVPTGTARKINVTIGFFNPF